MPRCWTPGATPSTGRFPERTSGEGEKTITEDHHDVSVVCADIIGFDALTAQCRPLGRSRCSMTAAFDDAGADLATASSIFVDVVRLVIIIAGLAVFFASSGARMSPGRSPPSASLDRAGLALQNAVGSVISGLSLLFELPFQLVTGCRRRAHAGAGGRGQLAPCTSTPATASRSCPTLRWPVPASAAGRFAVVRAVDYFVSRHFHDGVPAIRAGASGYVENPDWWSGRDAPSSWLRFRIPISHFRQRRELAVRLTSERERPPRIP